MKKVIFLTGEDLLDVDMPIVKEINNSFDLTWIVVLKGYGWFDVITIDKYCKENNIKYRILEQKTKLKNPLTLIFHLKVLSILKSYKAEIIYDSYLGVPYMHFFSRLFIKKDVFVIAIHDVVQHYKMKNRYIRSMYQKYLMNKYKMFHLFSKTQLELFKQYYPNKVSFFSPLCLKDFGPSKIEKLEKKTKNFLFFGIIRYNKGLDILISAANKLAKEYDNFTITIAGKCENWPEYENLIGESPIYKCIIRNIDRSEVPDLFNNADFLVLPYRDITQSGVLLTSYNYNVPVIASDLDGFKEYVADNNNGFLFKENDAIDLKVQMEKAIKLSNHEYEYLTKNLKGFVLNEISIGSITKRYIDFFTYQV